LRLYKKSPKTPTKLRRGPIKEEMEQTPVSPKRRGRPPGTDEEKHDKKVKKVQEQLAALQKTYGK